MTARSVRTHLAVTAAVTCVTAYFSYGYFHIDEYFQVLELVRYENGDLGGPLAWEIVEKLRPWLQPLVYFGFVKAFGVHDPFRMAFLLRLVTGLANVGALALLLRTTLPWLPNDDARKLHVRVLTLLGFLPYLYVRTSSESASMAALTAGFALLLRDATPGERRWTIPSAPLRSLLGGFLLGCAFELRFQTAFASAAIVVWLAVMGGRVGPLLAGALGAVGVGALADRWGYGEWQLTAWTYFKANILEGAAGTFGTDPPFAYLWMSPANVFAPVVVALMFVTVLGWARAPRHPLTAATLPFVLVHGLIAHKEERFLFPIAVLAAASVAFALAPSEAAGAAPGGRVEAIRRWLWAHRTGRAAKVIAGWSFAGGLLLAFVPLGWHLHVRFQRFVHDHIGEELHAVVTPEIELNFPAFRPRVYDVEKASPAEIARAVEAHTAREWLIMDRPDFRDAPALEGHATLVYSELPFAGDPAMRAREMRWVDAYNAHAPRPLRQVHYRSLFRLDR